MSFTPRTILLLTVVVLVFLQLPHVSHCLPREQSAASSSSFTAGNLHQPSSETAGRNQQNVYNEWRLLRLYPQSDNITKTLLKTVDGRDDIKIQNVHRKKSSIEVDLVVPRGVPLGALLKSRRLHPLCSLDHVARKGEPLPEEDVEALMQHRLENINDVTKGTNCRSGGGGEEDDFERKGKDREKKSFPAVTWLTLLDDLYFPLMSQTRMLTGSETFDFHDYYRYDSILRFAEDLAANNSQVGLLEIGQSIEGKRLIALVFSTNPSLMKKEYENKVGRAEELLTKGGIRIRQRKAKRKMKKWTEKKRKTSNSLLKKQKPRKGSGKPSKGTGGYLKDKKMKRKRKPVVLIEAGAHAREWISPAAALYVAKQVAMAGNEFLEGFNLVIVPVVNPDGYEYCHTTDRMWRKNRRYNGNCWGVDLNRNWGHEWGNLNGSSSDPCSYQFSGSEQFSEPEVKAVRDLMAVYLKNLNVHLNYHSYGQVVLFPWGCQSHSPPKLRKLKTMGRMLKREFSTETETYEVAQSADEMYLACGTSNDYMFSKGVPYSYIIELPNTYTFELPPEKIIPTGESAWSALVCLRDRIVDSRSTKKFCRKRLISVTTKDNATISSWISKKVPQEKAEAMVLKSYHKGYL